MLEKLHARINDIIPILGVCQNNDGTYRIDYKDRQPTQNELESIDSVLQNWPLEMAKAQKLAELDKKWELALQEGWTTPQGWKLGIDIQDVSLLTGAFILYKEISATGVEVPVHIVDMDGISRTLSFAELTGLMIQYGQFRSSVSASYANIKNLINEATNAEDLSAVSVDLV